MFCGSKKTIMDCYAEAGRSLDSETMADLDEVEQQLKEQNLGLDFLVFAAQCRICNYRETIIVPAVVDLDNMECRICSNRTMQEREALEWEDD